MAIALEDFSVMAQPDAVSSGQVRFEVENRGDIPHNFRVISTDLPPDQLPIAGGQVDESADQIQVIGGIQEFEAGQQRTLTVELAGGSHVLICNVPGHYQSGMRAAFEVT